MFWYLLYMAELNKKVRYLYEKPYATELFLKPKKKAFSEFGSR